MSPLERFSKWLQLRIYQFEVTFGLYIFTPVEKFIVYSVLFLLIGLTTIATVLYAPQHIKFVISRAWFYMNGDLGDASAADKQSLLGATARDVLGTAAASLARATAASAGGLREL